jgi:hypothetical protein
MLSTRVPYPRSNRFGWCKAAKPSKGKPDTRNDSEQSRYAVYAARLVSTEERDSQDNRPSRVYGIYAPRRVSTSRVKKVVNYGFHEPTKGYEPRFPRTEERAVDNDSLDVV